MNPATEEVLGGTADASIEDMRRAIGAARRAFDETDWSTNRELRKRCLLQLQAALEAEKEDLRAELVAEVGTPILITYGPQLDAPLEDGLKWPAETIDTFAWERDLPDGHAFMSNSRRKVVKEPVGVVGAIIPWNFPFEVTIQKVGQALATGNTMIVKPAPDTPWNATRLGRLVAEQTDIPAGVFNVVTSSDHLVGEELVLDPRVDLISFTGSTVTGRRIMEKGAATLKRLFLELGGKSADIILDDVDLPSRLAAAATVCIHGGQGCAMLTRMLLPRSRYDEGDRDRRRVVPQRHLRRPDRPRQHPGSADQREAARPRARLHREGRRRGRAPGARRWAAGASRQGLVRRADAVRRRREHDDDRAGGDLRPGARRDPVRGRRRRRPHRERQPVRPCRQRHLRVRRARAGRRRAVSAPG